MSEKNNRPVATPEREFQGPIWKHPYFVLGAVPGLGFLFLVIAAWLALKYGWLPGAGT